MKYLVLILFAVLTTLAAKGQSVNDFVNVYLQNGYTIRGVLIEIDSNSHVKIKLKSDVVREFKFSEIKKIEINKEENDELKYQKRQEVISKSFQLGLTFSPNINWIKQSQGPMSPNGSKFGYSWGFMADFNLNKNKQNFFLNFEFLSTRVFNKIRIKEDGTVFTRKNNTSSFDQVDLTFNINYIEIPISLKLKFNEIGYVTWFAQIGITPSILYSSKAKWTGIVANSSDEVSVEYYKNNSGEIYENEFHNFSDDSKYYRIGTFLGAGMEYRFSGNTALLASIRYNNGLSNFLNDKEDPRVTRVKATNKFIALHVGLLF